MSILVIVLGAIMLLEIGFIGGCMFFNHVYHQPLKRQTDEMVKALEVTLKNLTSVVETVGEIDKMISEHNKSVDGIIQRRTAKRDGSIVSPIQFRFRKGNNDL